MAAPPPPPPATHTPAVSGVVDALAQHAHAVQPGAISAEEAQQQPPAHRLVPQAALEAQGSPGEKRTQAPVPGRHAAQPSATAVALQQKPPRHAPAAHACGAEGPQGAPGGNRGEAEGEAAEVGGSGDETIGVKDGDSACVSLGKMERVDASVGAEVEEPEGTAQVTVPLPRVIKPPAPSVRGLPPAPPPPSTPLGQIKAPV